MPTSNIPTMPVVVTSSVHRAPQPSSGSDSRTIEKSRRAAASSSMFVAVPWLRHETCGADRNPLLVLGLQRPVLLPLFEFFGKVIARTAVALATRGTGRCIFVRLADDFEERALRGVLEADEQREILNERICAPAANRLQRFAGLRQPEQGRGRIGSLHPVFARGTRDHDDRLPGEVGCVMNVLVAALDHDARDRKSTRLNSSH